MNDVELAIVKRSIYELFGGDGGQRCANLTGRPTLKATGALLVLDFEMEQVHTEVNIPSEWVF